MNKENYRKRVCMVNKHIYEIYIPIWQKYKILTMLNVDKFVEN